MSNLSEASLFGMVKEHPPRNKKKLLRVRNGKDMGEKGVEMGKRWGET